MRQRTVVLLLTSLAILLLAGSYAIRSRIPMQTSSQKLRLHVGERMQDVLAENKLASFHPDKERDDTPIIWPEDDSKPATLDMTYDDGTGSVRLSHARMVWATQYAGVITDILVSASQQKLTLTDLYKEFKEAAEQLNSAGWSASAPLPAFATLESAVQGSNASGLEGGILTFTKGTVKAALEIKGFSHAPGTALPQSKDYTLNVRFSDRALHLQQQMKTYEERRRVNGNADGNLTLDHWLENARD